MVIEAMKMEHQITTPSAATVTTVRSVLAIALDMGDLLVELEIGDLGLHGGSIRIANCSGFFGDRLSGAKWLKAARSMSSRGLASRTRAHPFEDSRKKSRPRICVSPVLRWSR